MNTIKVEFDNSGFSLKEITDANGDTWLIEGYCSRCGECCLSPLLNGGYNDENGVCTKLVYETVDGSVNYRCSIYEKRPIGCVLWPRELADLQKIPECTYKITKK